MTPRSGVSRVRIWSASPSFTCRSTRPVVAIGMGALLLRVLLVAQIIVNAAGLGKLRPIPCRTHTDAPLLYLIIKEGVYKSCQLGREIPAGYGLAKPRLLSCCSLSRQSSRTLTQHCRLTLTPSSSSMSARAAEPIFFSIWPPLPMIIPLWLLRSQ